jgi:NTE family protein
MSQRKYALVLSGGGFKGAFQLGALEYIMKNGITHEDGSVQMNPQFSIIAGVSVGALNGSFMAMQDMDGLVNLWEGVIKRGPSKIYTSDYVELDEKGAIQIKFDAVLKKLIPSSLFSAALSFIFQKKAFLKSIGDNFKSIHSIADNTPLEKTLLANIKRDKFKIPFRMGFTSLVDGEYYAPSVSDFDSDTELAKAILASAALPIVFPYVDSVSFRKDNTMIAPQSLTDGGVRDISPLGDVIDYIKKNDPEGDYHIIIINCYSDKERQAESPVFDVGSYAFRVTNDILTSEVFRNDYANFLLINKLVTDANKRGFELRDDHNIPFIKFKYKLIQPEDPNMPGNDMGDTLDSRKETLKFRRAYGAKRTEEVMKIPTEIVNRKVSSWS